MAKGDLTLATIFTEGFDRYGPASVRLPSPYTTLPQGKWGTSPFGTISIDAPLSALGQAVKLHIFTNQVVSLTRTLPNNFTRLIGGIRLNCDLDENHMGVAFVDNSTTQCSIVLEPMSGFFTIRQGAAGAVLQQSLASVAANTSHYLEWDITFGTGAFGGWVVWLDGVQIMAGTGTTIQSANSYANVFQLIGYGADIFASHGNITFDDLYMFDTTTAFNNSAALSNPSVVTQFPIADHQQQFTEIGNVIGTFVTTTAAVFNPGANSLYLMPVTPNVNCTINTIVALPGATNGTAKFKGVIYSDVAGVPTTLLSSGTEVVGTTIDTFLDLPLVSPQALTAGTQYWIGWITDSSVNFDRIDGVAVLGQKASNTYGSGAPGTAPAMTTGQASLVVAGYCINAATNWQSEALPLPAGDPSSVSANTPGIEDLYTFPALPVNVVTVYTVGIGGNCRLTLPGVHTFDLVVSSAGMPGTGNNTNIAPTTSYAWYDSFFDTDPNTSAAWLPGNVTSSFSGMTIVS